jgi:hypothetical protein
MEKIYDDRLVGDDITMGPDKDDIWRNEFSDFDEDSDTAAGYSTLYHVPELKVSEGTPEVVVKFGHLPVRYEAHYLKTGEHEYGAHYKCHGPDCSACLANVKKVPRRIVFFYRPASQEIVYRGFTEDRKPDSFQSKLVRACSAGNPSILLIKKNDKYTFSITRLEHQDAVDYGEGRIRYFLTELQNDRVDFAGIIPEITPSDLDQIPEVETILLAMGLLK